MFDKKLEELLRQSVVSTLNEKNLLKEKVENKKEKKVIKEAYVAEPTHFDLKTELLSEKAKQSHQELFEGYIKELNATF